MSLYYNECVLGFLEMILGYLFCFLILQRRKQGGETVAGVIFKKFIFSPVTRYIYMIDIQ